MPAGTAWATPAGPAGAGTRQTLLEARVRAEGVGLVAMQLGPTGPAWLGAAGRESAAAGGGAMAASARLELGSITKLFTGLLLADAVQRGELKLDEAVEAVLPDALTLRDSAGAPLRWIDLATHRSGLPRLAGNMAPADPADPYADYDAAMLWRFLREHRADKPRDSHWEYSNLGFGLLGEALGLRLGQPFEAVLRARILRPLGLDSMQLAMTAQSGAATVPGHDTERRPVPRWRFRAMAGAGALTGTIGELARFARCVLGLEPHPLEAAVALATRRHAAGPGSAGMGLGWLIAPVPAPVGRTLLNHDGGTFGFSSSLWIDPAARLATAVVANAHVVVNDLALHLLDERAPLRNPAAEAAARREAVSRPALTLDAAALAPLAGVYALTPQFKLTLRVREARLFAQATGQGEFELFAEGPRRFFARVTPLTIEFEGEGGTAPALLLLQAGQRLRFVRE
jgi:CubicO group peptidase (beta-lactamase class C family)